MIYMSTNDFFAEHCEQVVFSVLFSAQIPKLIDLTLAFCTENCREYTNFTAAFYTHFNALQKSQLRAGSIDIRLNQAYQQNWDPNKYDHIFA